MRKKLISKTYMRGVSSWNFVVTKNEEENYFICIKQVNKIDQPFTIESEGRSTTFIDNGYYIVEFTPLDKYYNGRAYLNSNKELIEYYFDISGGNGEEENIPYYDDLFLDLMYKPNQERALEIYDEDELEAALSKNEISKDQYDLAYKAIHELMDEIKQGKNIFVNLDKKEFVSKFFK